MLPVEGNFYSETEGTLTGLNPGLWQTTRFSAEDFFRNKTNILCEVCHTAEHLTNQI